ncbi:hypothetical protein Kisp01_20570 [Kineosporia sp. NBRC 101677]|uniref:putative bifunctional diguanylate cyclase/phosphodiesterase n=1 Tax=Kineosporia sp. NBRC 101677 TaxID=3032197 RepID=UPI0024A1E230|nr:EAL domain-containing protein [Kineosporia sp. NBRC 101677]GLY15042.1 hypothetical protein Kisp01_20570 [Kineosporia sp. NBRC 101677]
MSEEPGLHRLLTRQLRRLELDRDQSPPQPAWARLLSVVSATYEQADNDRYLLERSLEVSSAEMLGLHNSLSRKAMSDELTGLPNRRALLERLQYLVGSQDPDGPAVAVLFIDLDGFKLVNDSLGHDAGDELLVLTADRLQAVCRDGDVVARLGGDEFIVAGRFDGVGQAQALAERIAAELQRPLLVRNHEVTVGASIGVALADDDGSGPATEAVLQRADLAMYAAKQGGRSRMSVFDPKMQLEADRSLQLLAQLRTAVAEGDLDLRYRPVVDLGQADPQRLLGAQAVLSWRPPESTAPITGGEIRPIAEKYRLMADLDTWMLREACRQGARGPEGAVWVNVSLQTFTSLDVVGVVRDCLQHNGLAPGRLWIQLAEEVFMSTSTPVTANLAGLRELGVGLGMDGLGSGLCALTRLRGVPQMVLKLDPALVADLDRHEAGAAIAGAAISMGHALGHLVVADGVERRSQADLLRAVGCDAGQGAWFGPATAAEALATARSQVVS